jgi:MinD-like ATPase involved in chromosome partitioning or flagellar assembly
MHHRRCTWTYARHCSSNWAIASAVSEALAEGTTVIDYAPGSPVAEDYMLLAGWLQSFVAPAAVSHAGVRWSER